MAGQRYPDDDGAADPGAAAALAAYEAGQGSEHAALLALAGTRLLVPVVAVLTEEESTATGSGAGRLRREKTSEVRLPLLVGNDGRHAVLAFTCSEALARWRPDARPVPVPATEVWQAGAGQASAVVVDVAGPVPLTIEGARLAALAAGQPAPAPEADPDLLAAADAALAGEPLLAGGTLAAARSGGDVALLLRLAPGTDPAGGAVQAAIQRAAGQLMAAAGGRLRRGVEVTVDGPGAR